MASAKKKQTPKNEDAQLALVAHLVQDAFKGLGAWTLTDLVLGLKYLKRERMRTREEKPVESAIQDVDLVRMGLHYAILTQASYCLNVEEFVACTSLPRDNVLVFETTSTMLRPGYYVAVDDDRREVILCVRGTANRWDALTDVCAATEAFDLAAGASTDGHRAVQGHVHHGMKRAADWFLANVLVFVRRALQSHPGYTVRLLGHSLGAATAAMITLLLTEGFSDVKPALPGATSVTTAPTPVAPAAAPQQAVYAAPSKPKPAAVTTTKARDDPTINAAVVAAAASADGSSDVAVYAALRAATCVCYAPPPCMTADLSERVADKVVSFVLNNDLVPRASLASIEKLRADMEAYAWEGEFMRDVSQALRESFAGRAVGSAMGNTYVKGATSSMVAAGQSTKAAAVHVGNSAAVKTTVAYAAVPVKYVGLGMQATWRTAASWWKPPVARGAVHSTAADGKTYTNAVYAAAPAPMPAVAPAVANTQAAAAKDARRFDKVIDVDEQEEWNTDAHAATTLGETADTPTAAGTAPPVTGTAATTANYSKRVLVADLVAPGTLYHVFFSREAYHLGAETSAAFGDIVLDDTMLDDHRIVSYVAALHDLEARFSHPEGVAAPAPSATA